jgi:AraC-like DNA-binding protein
MHRRTLDRRLKTFAVNFQALNDEVRYEVARQLLDDTAIPVTAIAQSLHYNDTSAFTHAFRRWSGCSPTQWRASSGQKQSRQA